jgi:hypothetical protein
MLNRCQTCREWFDVFAVHWAEIANCPTCQAAINKAKRRDYIKAKRSGAWKPTYNIPFRVFSDPCDAPFSKGAELSFESVKAGLIHGSFEQGMVFQQGNKMLEVCGQELVEVKA